MTKKTTFLEKCKGIALILGILLFGTAAIFFSMPPAQADRLEPLDNLQSIQKLQKTQAAGKYQMAITSAMAGSGDLYWYIVVWDTETGKSKMYYGSPKMGKTAPSASSFDLPENPL